MVGSLFVLASMVLFFLRDLYTLYFDDYLDNFYEKLINWDFVDSNLD